MVIDYSLYISVVALSVLVAAWQKGYNKSIPLAWGVIMTGLPLDWTFLSWGVVILLMSLAAVNFMKAGS